MKALWKCTSSRGGSRAAATSKMERFVIIVNGWNPLTTITKHSILDVAAALDPPLVSANRPKLYGNCAFTQYYHTRKLGGNSIF